MAQVTELITSFKFEGSEAPLNKYNASLGKGVGLLVGMTAAIAATGAMLAKWTTGVLAAEQPLINLSAETGVAVERLQELQYIASVSNSSAGALASTMGTLSAKIGEAAQKGSEEFSRLGISVRYANGQVKDADQILGEVGQRFRTLGLSLREQRSFAESLGIDPSLVTMLNRTSEEMDSLSQRARELGTLTEEQTAFAQDYNDSMTSLRFSLDGVRRLIAIGLGPELKKMTESLTELIAENKDWIVNGIKATVTFLGDFLEMIGRVWPLIAAGAGLFIALKIATMGWAAVLGAILSPALLVVAGITAIILIVDDLIVAFRGGDSVIKEFFQNFLGIDITKVLRKMVDAFKDFFAKIGDMVPDWFTNLFGDDEKSVSVESMDSSMRPGGSSSVQSSSRSVNQDIQMTINTSDPVKAGRVAADTLQAQMDNAQMQSDRGGR